MQKRHPVNRLDFKDLESAWAGINEFLAQKEAEIVNGLGGVYGPEIITYNNYVVIRHCKMNPEFDFGKILGYHQKKWSSLVNNYCNINYLDLIKTEIEYREKRLAKSYNYTFHFDNAHGSGKDCLISLTFTKRVGYLRPILVFTVRTSEVTKRLPFDLLLVQRIAEYVYGPDQDCEVHFMAPSFYITAESFVMYNNYKPIKKVLREYKGRYGKFQKRVIKTLKDFMHPDARNIKYKVFHRSVMQIQKDEHGNSLSGTKSLKAKDLKLVVHKEEFPENIISPKARTAFRRAQKKKSKK